MKLFDVLEANDPSSPCAIYHQTHSDDESENRIALTLTYQSAKNVLLQHEEIIRTKVKDVVTNNSTNTKTNNSNQQEVVIAILADNSVDLLLVILACTRLNRVLPVLLNTRWTHQEIVQALLSQNRRDQTIFMYDDSNSNSNSNGAASEYGQRIVQAAALLRENHSGISIMRLSMLTRTHRTIPTSLSSTGVPSQNDNSNKKNRYLPNSTKQQGDDDTALVLFTSGTTSGSKGVLLSHGALYIQAWAKLQPPCAYDTHTRMLATTVPFFHVGGLSSALAVLLAGGSLVFPPPPPSSSSSSFPATNDIDRQKGFRPTQVLASLRQAPCFSSNTLVVVPAMLTPVMDHLKKQQQQQQQQQSERQERFLMVRLVLIGGQSASPTLLQQIDQYFPNARIVQTYACTEGASSLTFWERTNNNNDKNRTDCSSLCYKDDDELVGDCVGVPPSHVQLKLLLPSTNNEGAASTGSSCQPKVIATRGPHLLTGYWRRGGGGEGAASSIYAFDRPLTPTGWFVTNDLGYQDARGNYYFCGRLADVIRTGGETVLAPEVEKALLAHPQIQECAVFSLPDSKFGEAVCTAIIVGHSSSNSEIQIAPSLKDVRNWCAEKGLAGYKRPRRLFVLAELPRNSSGKLLKRLLQNYFRGALEADEATSKSYRSKL